MSKSHSGRVALVTGAGRGIGRAIAKKLAELDAKVILVDRDDPGETAALIGPTATSLQADVSRDEEWARIAALADTTFGRCDIVVNNAGIYPTARIEDLTVEVWRQTLAVNLDAHFFSARHLVPLMRRNGWGRFVNISSSSIGTPLPGNSHYMASKMGVIGFVRGLANDVAEFGITVNAVLPTIVQTPGTRDAPPEFAESVWRQQAIKRFSEPNDLVGPIAFLTSEDAHFITGQALPVDGGLYKVG